MYVTVPITYRDETERTSYNTARFGESGIPDWIAAAGVPQLLEQDLIETRLGRDAASRLDPLIAQALQFWRAEIPLVDGEQLVAEKMACFAEPWAGLATGTLVFLRDTTKARMAFVLPAGCIDVKNGTLSATPDAIWNIEPLASLHGPVPRHPAMMRAMATAGAGGSEVKAIVDSALTAITFVGFGINGPWGLALAGAAAVAEVLFNSFFNTGQKSLGEQVGEVVNRLLGKQEITDRANVVHTSISVFLENWKGMKTMDTRQLETLRDVAVHQVQDTSDLNQAINFLRGNLSVSFMDIDELKRKAVTLYGLAISTKLLWIKLALLLDDSPEVQGNKTKSGYLNTMVSVGDEAVAYIDAVIGAIEGAITARASKVYPCEATSYTLSILGSSSTTHCVAFQDSDDSWNSYTIMTNSGHFNEMVTANQGCCGQDPQWDTCKQKREAYIAKIKGQVRDSYSYDHDAVASLREKLANTVELYRPYLRH